MEPVGGQRADFHAKFVAMHSGRGMYGEHTPTTAEFPMPWDDPAPED